MSMSKTAADLKAYMESDKCPVYHGNHQFTIPVEWKEQNIAGGKKVSITKLRCQCGEETER